MEKLSLAVIATVTVIVLSSAASAQATGDSTQTSAPTGATATAGAAPAATVRDPNEVICETQPPPTGSILGGTRVCMTRAQWKAQENQTGDWSGLHNHTH
jgi:hypothetical protein